MSSKEKVEEGDYGVVFIKGGEYKGNFGYYDDDDCEDNKVLAIVYLGAPCLSNYVLINRKHLRVATQKEVDEYAKRHKDPIVN